MLLRPLFRYFRLSVRTDREDKNNSILRKGYHCNIRRFVDLPKFRKRKERVVEGRGSKMKNSAKEIAAHPVVHLQEPRRVLLQMHLQVNHRYALVHQIPASEFRLFHRILLLETTPSETRANLRR